ncbi:PREDICTED: nicotinamide N-methyltransferase-like [Amphimedon queenslandica]|uniref:Uncharacterized protein n=1 Tax=Amphimedon queenslandica TaxID=400682 RepID=A0AAN0IN20_AMPQE|nr:PREDICTED: nicotinamide N-methyltransferase-like [Amphimedon queenslandica]|eukprot:XP_011404625.2 PREDICTED: nicotinamide N-methyltransferase-like [Amphimedon queenslandica]
MRIMQLRLLSRDIIPHYLKRISKWRSSRLIRVEDTYTTHFCPIPHLKERYGNPEPSATLYCNFILKSLHQFFQLDLLPSDGELQVLDYGCGPVICNVISASKHARSITMAEYTPQGREVVEQWLNGSLTSFDWSPHFDYIVQTLEGKSEEEARERERSLRKKMKGVVSCDLTKDPPIDPQYLGPYDIIVCSLVINTTSSSIEEHQAQMNRLASLIKKGGYLLFVTCLRADGNEGVHQYHYFCGGSDVEYNAIAVSMKCLFSMLEASGLAVVSSSDHLCTGKPDIRSNFIFVAGRKV